MIIQKKWSRLAALLLAFVVLLGNVTITVPAQENGEASFNYDYPLSGAGDNQVFPGRELYIEPEIGCWAQSPAFENGEYVHVPVKSVTVTEGSEFLTCEKDADGGYVLRGESCGEALVRVEYEPVEGDGREGVYMREIVVTEDIYYLNWRYPEGTDMMLKGGSMTIGQVSMNHGHYEKDGETGEENECWEDVAREDFSLELDEESYDKEVVGIRIDGHDIIIDAKDYGSVTAHIQGKIDGKACAEMEVNANVTDGYSNLLPFEMENVPIGETLDLNLIEWSLMIYDETENRDGKEILRSFLIGGGRLRAEYDENAWEETGDKNGSLPVLRRKTDWGTNVTVIAEENPLDEEGNPVLDENGEEIFEERGRRDLWFDGLGYQADLQFGYGGRDCPRLFTDSPLTLSLTDSEDSYPLPEGCEVEWVVGQYDENGTESVPEFIEARENLQEKSVTLSIKPESGEVDGSWIYVEAVISYEGNEIARANADLEISEPVYYYDDPFSEWNQILFNNGREVGNSMICFVRNADCPEGMDLERAITKLEVAGQYDWDEETRDWTETSEAVLKIEKTESGWILSGERCGKAVVRITYEPAPGDSGNTMECDVYVSDDIYYLAWGYPEGRDHRMLPNSEMRMPAVRLRRHQAGDEKGQVKITEISDFELSVRNDDGSPVYNEDLLEVTAEGKELVIRSGADCGFSRIYLRAMVDGEECCVADIQIDVVESYEKIFCEKIYRQPGESFTVSDLKPVMKRFSKERPEGIEVENVSFRFNPMQDDIAAVWEKNATVRADFTSEAWPCWEWIDIIGETDGGQTEVWDNVSVMVCKHDWENAGAAKAATCTADGVKTVRCRHCGLEKTEIIAATGHRFGAWSAVSPASVLAKERQARTCPACGVTQTREFGEKKPATVKLAASSLKMKTKQKASVTLASGMADGDYVQSVTSDKTNILKVSNVKQDGSCRLSAGKKTGTAKLSVTLASGLTRTIKVTVQKKDVKTTKISCLPKKLNMKKGEKLTLAPALVPVTTQQKAAFKSSNTKVASVNAKGQVKAKKAGKAKITIKSGSKKCTVSVTVK